MNFSQKTNVEIRHMRTEDAGLELFPVEEVMLAKKLKMLVGHL